MYSDPQIDRGRQLASRLALRENHRSTKHPAFDAVRGEAPHSRNRPGGNRHGELEHGAMG